MAFYGRDYECFNICIELEIPPWGHTVSTNEGIQLIFNSDILSWHSNVLEKILLLQLVLLYFINLASIPGFVYL